MARPARSLRRMSRKQVRIESEKQGQDLVIIGDKVYDVSKWKKRHPGGELPLLAMRGRDATDPFNNYHPPEVAKTMLKCFEYATLEDFDEGSSKVDVAFRELTQKLIADGFFETNYWYYARKVLWFASIMACVLYGALYCESTLSHFVAAMTLGLFFQQVAFIGHDLGHNAVTHNLDNDGFLGLFFGNFLTGISIGWWKRSHNVHHIVTNSIEHDPDIQHLPVFAVSPVFLKESVFSTFYDRILPNTKLAHIICRHQHWLYYPVMGVARFNLYAQSLLHLLGISPYKPDEYIWGRNAQLFALFGFYTWLSLLTMQLPTVFERFMFIFVSHFCAGILHVQITLSHFSMPTYQGVTYTDATNGFVTTQLSTSMDVECSRAMDWFHGGLQFQVVHHLWPRMPRHNLRRAQDHLLKFCAEHNLKYHSCSFVQANRVMLAKLQEASKSTRHISDMLWESFYAFG